MRSGQRRRATLLLAFAGFAGAASAQGTREARAAEAVVLVAAHMSSCVRVDTLLRDTCARIGAKLSEKNRRHCELPAVSFEARTASAYQAHRQRHQDTIRANDARIAAAVERERSAFERQFAEMRAGRVSMLDLESLARDLRERCAVVEREWLTAQPRR